MKNIYSTGVRGLDLLFKQGLFIDGANEDGLIILIKGQRGTNKTELALQMMYGLSLSLLTSKDSNNNTEKPDSNNDDYNKLLDRDTAPSIYYSITKSNKEIVPLCLDISVKENIDLFINQNTICRISGDKESEETIADSLYLYFTKVFQGGGNKGMEKENNELKDLAKKILNSTAIYNSRSHKLETVSDRNDAQKEGETKDFGVSAKSDYFPSGPGCGTAKANGKESGSDKDCVQFYYKSTEKEGGVKSMNVLFKEHGNNNNPLLGQSHPNATFRGFYEEIVKLESDCRNESGVGQKDKFFRRPVVVMDGFSHIPDGELHTLPYNTLFAALRKKARVSILVMDERDVVDYDADIVIYTRHKYDNKNDYCYTQLQIGKCVFQESALGWHQYKLRDKNIEVYPSVHRILSQPSHYHNQGVNIGESIYVDHFDREGNVVEESEGKVEEKYNNCLKSKSDVEGNMCSFCCQRRELCKLCRIICCNDTNFNAISYKKEDNPPNGQYYRPEGTTALIGNPNTYKRFLCRATTYSLAQQGVHTLYIFFDKDTRSMRTKLFCPATNAEEASFGKGNASQPSGCNNCAKCINKIHSIDLLHGCLSADEFFYMLQAKIDLFTKDEHGNQRHGLHIVIDDLQIIEFCFPMLIDNSLFLSTLVSICRKNKVKLTVLSDKHAKLVNSLCALSDNILAIRREDDWVNRIEIQVERGLGDNISVFSVDNPKEMFRCLGSERGLAINDDSISKYEEKGSMKYYWRDTYFYVGKDETWPPDNQKNTDKNSAGEKSSMDG